MMRNLHVWCAALVLVASACEFEASCGKVSKKKVEKELAEDLASVGVEKVECPKLKKGKTVTCKAHAAGGRTFDITVKRTSDGVEWETKDVAKGVIVANDIQTQFSKQGLPLTGVSCPELIDPKGTATCTGTAEGIKIDVLVQMSKQPNYHIGKGVVAMRNVAQVLGKQAASRGISAVTCPPNRILLLKAGQRAVCKGQGPKGEALEIEIEIKDSKGDFRWRPRPAGGGAAPANPTP